MDVHKDIKSPKVSVDDTAFLHAAKQRVEAALVPWLESTQYTFDNLKKAMHYAVLNGGKRIRAALIYSLEKELQLPSLVCDYIAMAIEVMHASSLVHDDLPALDNDTLRRGKPSCHVVFGEAMALLAGDALLNLSFQIINAIPETILSANKIVGLQRILSKKIGSNGLIGGQAMEFAFDKHPLCLADLEKLYSLKTGCLLGCGLQMALFASDSYNERLSEQFDNFSYYLGLSFQIQDDILGLEMSTEQLGKPQFSDVRNKRQTLVALLGVKQAKQRVAHYQKKVYDILDTMNFKDSTLRCIVDYIVKRQF